MTVLVIGHAVDDLYQGAVPAIVPFLVAERSYGYLAASGSTVAATLLSSVVQPLFGVLTDRRQMPWLVPLAISASEHKHRERARSGAARTTGGSSVG